MSEMIKSIAYSQRDKEKAKSVLRVLYFDHLWDQEEKTASEVELCKCPEASA